MFSNVEEECGDNLSFKVEGGNETLGRWFVKK